MNGDSATRRLEQFERALARLNEAAALPVETPFAIEATVKLFEMAFELGWKSMKAFLELEVSGPVPATARAVLKEAYTAGWIDDEQAWIELLDMRNSTSHIYNEELARQVYLNIKANLPVMFSAARLLREKAG